MVRTEILVVQSGQMKRSSIELGSECRIVLVNPTPEEALKEAFRRKNEFILSPFVFYLSNGEKVISEPTIIR